MLGSSAASSEIKDDHRSQRIERSAAKSRTGLHFLVTRPVFGSRFRRIIVDPLFSRQRGGPSAGTSPVAVVKSVRTLPRFVAVDRRTMEQLVAKAEIVFEKESAIFHDGDHVTGLVLINNKDDIAYKCE